MLKKTTRGQRLGWVLFCAYLTLLVYFMFFSESFGRDPAQRSYAYNLELFKEIKRFYQYREILGIKAFLLNVVGNVVAFVPCGFFLPVILKKAENGFITVLLCFGLSLCIEFVQLVSMVGSFDVDDLLLNTLGGFLGCLIYWILRGMKSGRRGHG